MNLSEPVNVKPFKFIGEDSRGLTQTFSLPRQQQEFIYIIRKKGSVSGNSYHTGKDIATKPKCFILLSGEIEFSYRQVGSTNKNTIQLVAPIQIEVMPNTVHAVKALSDIIMIECNSLAALQNDIFKEVV